MQSEQLIQTLLAQTKQITDQAAQLERLDLNVLTWKQNENSWSILECLEHLNLYGDFYLPEIDRKIKSTNTKSDLEFKSGILGNYFAKSMLPKEHLNKMKTFKDKNPLNAKLDITVINRFIQQQNQLITLLNQSRKVSLNKVRIEISISKLIKLKLGDTFQFFINHIIRHFKQIENIQAAIKTAAN